MGRMFLGVPIAMAIAMGCGGDAKPAPSCQQAMAHFYGVNCFYYDGSVSPARRIAQTEMVANCQQLAIAAPARCQGEIDDWLECNANVEGVPSGTPTTIGDLRCDCSQEQMTILRCN